jgi:hypothetical protein
MGKVSIGLRGWRFDEEAVFNEDGQFRPIDQVPEEERARLFRLTTLLDRPCDACWLIHGDEEIERCNPPVAVYGEPTVEVLVCGEHEADFYYWYFEAGDEQLRGEQRFRDEFHEWFAGGSRAPDDYAGLDHVDTAPADVPEPRMPDPSEFAVEPPEEERVRVDLRAGEIREGAAVDDGEDVDGETGDLDTADVDLDTEYP